MNLVEVQVDTGAERPISSHRWASVEQVAWLSDGTGLVMVAGEKLLGSTQLWSLSYPEGSLRRITNDPNTYIRLSVAANSKTIVTARLQRRSSIWKVRGLVAGEADQITDESFGNFTDVCCLLDGRIAFVSIGSGDREIWIMVCGREWPRQLTADGFPKFWPSASSDGKYIVFSSRGPDAHHVWRMDADGGNPQQLTSGVGENSPSCTPDGWVLYASGRPNETVLYRVPIQGGSPVQITDKRSNYPRISPDGKMIACWWKDEPAAGWNINHSG